MIGHPQYAALNAPLAARLAPRRPLIAVHRGSGRGTIAENTINAVHAALAEGADVVEIDIIASTDGDLFLFHNGYESMHFGIDRDIRTMSTAEIEALQYVWCREQQGTYPVARLASVLETFPQTFFNVDRSWFWWPPVLDALAKHASPGHLLVKSPVEDDYLAALAEHPLKLPYIPIVRSIADVERVWARPDINTVGVELVTAEPTHEFVDPDYIASLQHRGLAVLVNAINLSNGIPLYAGYDDETSLVAGPEHGWAELLNRNVDLIQTDWPGVLLRYLDERDRQGAVRPRMQA